MSIVKYLEDENNPNQPISSSLYSRLQEDILLGKWHRGDRLTEKKICDEYQVSRTPVRETIGQLEADGLVETIPNRGAFVIGLSRQDVLDIMDLRADGEMRAAGWAAERIQENELKKLNETYEYMVFYTGQNDLAKMVDINAAFHRIIYEATHNRILIRQMRTYQIYLQHTTRPIRYTAEYLNELLREHTGIYEGIVAGDPEAARAAAENYLLGERRRRQLLEPLNGLENY